MGDIILYDVSGKLKEDQRCLGLSQRAVLFCDIGRSPLSQPSGMILRQSGFELKNFLRLMTYISLLHQADVRQDSSFKICVASFNTRAWNEVDKVQLNWHAAERVICLCEVIFG